MRAINVSPDAYMTDGEFDVEKAINFLLVYGAQAGIFNDHPEAVTKVPDLIRRVATPENVAFVKDSIKQFKDGCKARFGPFFDEWNELFPPKPRKRRKVVNT